MLCDTGHATVDMQLVTYDLRHIMAVAKNKKNGGILWPDIYMHGECHKVKEKHLENRF